MNVMIFNRDEVRVADLDWSVVHLPKEIHDTQGEMKFQMSYPISEEDSVFLVEGNFIVIPDFELPNQFQAYEIITKETDDTFITVDCDHRYVNDLNGGEVVSFNTNDDMADIAIIAALEKERWQVGIVEVTTRRKVSVLDMQPLEALRYIEKEWGGELRFRIEMVGAKFNKFYVDLLQRRGAFNGVRFEFGHNLTDFRHTLDFSGVVTAMYGRGQGESVTTEEESTTDETVVLTFKDIAWSTANGDPVNKPLGQDWVGDETARLKYGRPNGSGGRKHIFAKFESQSTTPGRLLYETWEQVKKNSEPIFSVEAGVQPLSELSPDFEYERTNLGDDVFVIFRHKNQNISLKSRILKVERDRKTPENSSYEIGNYTMVSFSERMMNVENETDITKARRAIHDRAEVITNEGKVPTNVLDGVIDAVNNEIVSTMGFVYQDENGILILDKPRDQSPTKAMRLGGGVFALADSKTAAGEWNWRTFGDGGGFVADELIAGSIKTDLIEIFGSANFRWNGNNIYITDPTNSQKQIRIGNFEGSKYGIAFTTDGGLNWDASMDFTGLHMDVANVEGVDAAISLKATQITTAAVNAIKIGGANIIPNSTFNFGAEHWNYGTLPTYATIIEGEADKPTSKIIEFAGTTANLWQVWSDAVQIDADGSKEFTISFDILVEDVANFTGNVFAVRTFDVTDKSSQADSVWYQNVTLAQASLTSNKWKRYYLTVTPTTGKYIKIAPYQNGGISKARWREFQVEEGNKNTTWKPSQKDAIKETEALASRIVSAEELIYSDKIVSKVLQSTDMTDLMAGKVNQEALADYTSSLQLQEALEGVDQATTEKIELIDFTPYVKQADFEREADAINAKIKAGGGVNILVNSLGFAGFDFWETNRPDLIQTVPGQTFEPHNFGSGWFFPPTTVSRSIAQMVQVIEGQEYNLSWLVKKMNVSTAGTTAGALYFQILDENNASLKNYTYNSEVVTEGFESNNFTWTATFSGNIKIRVFAYPEVNAYVTGLMFTYGTEALQHTFAPGENYNMNVGIDLNGVRVARVQDGATVGYSQLSPEGVEGFYKKYDEVSGNEFYEKTFYFREDETVSKKFRAINEFTMGTIKIVEVANETKEGWAFVPTVKPEDME
jgi:phage minor structural protein